MTTAGLRVYGRTLAEIKRALDFYDLHNPTVLLPREDQDIAIVADDRRSAWLSEDERRQPHPPSQAAIDAAIARRDARLRGES